MPLLHVSAAFKALLTAWDAWLLTLLVGIAFPAYGYFFLYRKLREAPEAAEASARRSAYMSIIVAQWLLVAGLVFVARRHHLSAADLGQHLNHPRRILVVTGCLLAVLGILAVQNIWQLRRTASEKMAAHLGPVRKFLPVGKGDLITWVALSLTAGVCEELLFRGWMVNFLGAAMGSIWIGLVLSSLWFGLGHAYQGGKGILVTGLAGLVFGLVYVGVGSLVPGQVLHALVDIVNGFIGAGILVRIRSLPKETTGQG